MLTFNKYVIILGSRIYIKYNKTVQYNVINDNYYYKTNNYTNSN